MSSVKVSLRLSGTLPPTETLNQLLGVKPTKSLRRGEKVLKRRVQPVDLWSLTLAKYDSDRSPEEIEAQLLQAAIVLEKLAPALAQLDRTECNADLYISTIREEDQGGLSLPPELIIASGAAKLSLQVSILVMLEDDDLEPEDLQSEDLESPVLVSQVA